MKLWIARQIYPTLRAIAVTGNRWRARDRLFMDGGSGGWSILIGRRMGWIEPKGHVGHCVIGGHHDMVRLTPKGVAIEAQLAMENSDAQA